jgi:hypothetical protein
VAGRGSWRDRIQRRHRHTMLELTRDMRHESEAPCGEVYAGNAARVADLSGIAVPGVFRRSVSVLTITTGERADLARRIRYIVE